MSNRRQDERQFGRFKLTKREGSDNWYAIWYDDSQQKTKRLSLRCTDIDEAERRLARQFILHEPMRRDDPHNVPLRVILERYFDRYAKHLRSAGVARAAIDSFNEFFGDQSVAGLTRDEQQRYVRAMYAKGLSPGYIKRRVCGVLRPAMTTAFDSGELDRVPAILKPGYFGPDNQRNRILSPDEMAALWDAVYTDRMRMTFVLAINTLARPEAIYELTREQADLQNRLLYLNPEGRKQEPLKHRPVVPITDTLYPWLSTVDSGRLITYQGKGVLNLQTQLRKTRKAAGLGDDVTLYTFRHTLATELRQRGVAPWDADGIMGHKVPGMIERYAKYSPKHLADAVEAIDTYCRDLPIKTVPLVLDAVPIRAKGA